MEAITVEDKIMAEDRTTVVNRTTAEDRITVEDKATALHHLRNTTKRRSLMVFFTAL